jgi:hypothetical protein
MSLVDQMDLLQGILCSAILNGCVIIIYDWRYKAVPLYLLLLFGCLSVIYGGMTHSDWQTMAILVSGSFVILRYLVYKKMLGFADCLLIPCCFALFINSLLFCLDSC